MAIAHVSTTFFGNNSGTSYSNAFDCGSASGRYVIAWFVEFNTDTDDVSSVTYAGGAMSLLGKINASGSCFVYVYGVAPSATGSNNLIINTTGTQFVIAGASLYTGVSGTQPDNSATNATGTSTTSCSLTPNTANCWGILVAGFTNGNTPTSTTGHTRRAYDTSFGCVSLFDTDGTIAGSTSMGATNPASGGNSVMIALAEDGGGGGGGPVIPVFMNQYRQRWG